MKKLLAAFTAVSICLFACKKSNDSNKSTGSTFTATVNGQVTTFAVNAATLVRSQPDNEKRMDITGTSLDSSKRMTITLGLETYIGSGMTVKSYDLNPFPEDDPSTPDIDESATTEGYTTYSTSLGNGNWLTDVYDEQGTFVITSCDSAHTTVSGTFQTTLTDNNSSPAVVIAITAGKVTNVKYTALN